MTKSVAWAIENAQVWYFPIDFKTRQVFVFLNIDSKLTTYKWSDSVKVREQEDIRLVIT